MEVIEDLFPVKSITTGNIKVPWKGNIFNSLLDKPDTSTGIDIIVSFSLDKKVVGKHEGITFLDTF